MFSTRILIKILHIRLSSFKKKRLQKWLIRLQVFFETFLYMVHI